MYIECSRCQGQGVVGIVALTEKQEVVLTEQERVPLGARVVEFPAGLVGDEQSETILEAAHRELLEETGFRAGRMELLFSGPTSAGLTDECITLVRAFDLERVDSGGGVDQEAIEVHTVALEELSTWLQCKEQAGIFVDLKVRLTPLLVESSSCA